MRDHRRLRVFDSADKLAERIYKETATFPRDEQYGLVSQLRRAAVSIATNIVEGCARSTRAEYLRFLDIAYGSAKELEYEVELCARLGFIRSEHEREIKNECATTAKLLCNLIMALRRLENS